MRKLNPWMMAGGVIIMLIGVVWFFQGIGSLAGSPMTGVIIWSYLGAILLILGIAVFLRGLLGTRRN